VKSLQVQNGDLVASSGSLVFAQGSSKLIQALTLWLKEPLLGIPPIGPGFTTPSFGSVLESYIGQSNVGLMQTQVKAEVLRILGLYNQTQLSQLQKAQTVGSLNYWDKSEIIQRVISVDVSSTTNQITASVAIQTLANNSLSLDIIVGQNGITVV
jgi:hypothetical protein